MLDIPILILIFFLGFKIKFLFKDTLDKNDYKYLNILWLYHLIFGVAYWYYVSYISIGDAVKYYFISSENTVEFLYGVFITEGLGTPGMYFINTLPSKLLSFFGASIFYSFLGYIGIVYFYAFFKRNINYNSTLLGVKLFPLVFFLPNLHFWSAGIGKDTLCFLAIALFFYGMQQPSKNLLKLFLAIALTYIVRPHMTVFLVAAFGFAFLLDGRLKVYQKIFLSTFFFVGLIVLFNKFMEFMRLESLNIDTIERYSHASVDNLLEGSGSGVDVTEYPYPLKVFTFMYRPLFFDINGVLALVASFENLLLLLLSIKLIFLNPIKLFIKGNPIFKGVVLFFLAGALTFPLILGNLGIMLREKNMFIPAFLFICFWAFSYSYELKKKM